MPTYSFRLMTMPCLTRTTVLHPCNIDHHLQHCQVPPMKESRGEEPQVCRDHDSHVPQTRRSIDHVLLSSSDVMFSFALRLLYVCPMWASRLCYTTSISTHLNWQHTLASWYDRSWYFQLSYSHLSLTQNPTMWQMKICPSSQAWTLRSLFKTWRR
jgi:hypothetical protein